MLKNTKNCRKLVKKILKLEDMTKIWKKLMKVIKNMTKLIQKIMKIYSKDNRRNKKTNNSME